jgi:hypothetical protein
LLELDRDGAQLVAQALLPSDLASILHTLQPRDERQPGLRLDQLDSLQAWLGGIGVVGKIAANRLGPHARPVRAILFDKNVASNWALGWHQDRTIAVNRRADVHGFENWNRKGGIDHVEPPFELIERMLTLRIHFDPASKDNAPLLISPGTHRLGKVVESRLVEVVERHGSFECIADAGDIWVYRTAILHASRRASSPTRRRVLQVDYSADRLPAPLRWHMAV